MVLLDFEFDCISRHCVFKISHVFLSRVEDVVYVLRISICFEIFSAHSFFHLKSVLLFFFLRLRFYVAAFLRVRIFPRRIRIYLKINTTLFFTT